MQKGAKNQALGRFSTKIHAACDAHGNPLRFILTGGEISDYRCALTLIDGMKADALLADKGYNADYIIEAAQAMGQKWLSRQNRIELFSVNMTRLLV